MQSPKNTKYLFIDMNAFFASCEQQKNPCYRNKPLVVTPVNAPTGCVVAKSYEAKKYGINTGTLIRDAKKFCPQIIVRESNTFLYLSFHERLVNILKSFSPWLNIMSVDEAVIKLSKSEQNSQKAKGLANRIKQSIHLTIGEYMTSSIGIGPNVFLAKQAAEFQKPDGLVEIKLENLRDYYSKIQLTDIKGINFRMKRQFNIRGIFTPLELYNCSSQKLKTIFGMIGEYWYLKLHGHDINYPLLSVFQSDFISVPKSVGQSHVLEPKFRNWQSAWSVCLKLASRACKRLRTDNLQAASLILYIKFLKRNHWFQRIKLANFSDNLTMTRILIKLWQKIPKTENQPLKIGLVFYKLSKVISRQQKLFPKEEKQTQLSKTIDKINDLYGNFTIKSANLLSVKSAAPSRISFGKPMYD